MGSKAGKAQYIGFAIANLTVNFHDLSPEINTYPQLSPSYPQKIRKPAKKIAGSGEASQSRLV